MTKCSPINPNVFSMTFKDLAISSRAFVILGNILVIVSTTCSPAFVLKKEWMKTIKIYEQKELF